MSYAGIKEEGPSLRKKYMERDRKADQDAFRERLNGWNSSDVDSMLAYELATIAQEVTACRWVCGEEEWWALSHEFFWRIADAIANLRAPSESGIGNEFAPLSEPQGENQKGSGE